MGKFAYLVMVTAENNNKFYSMEEKDGQIIIFNGRVDVSKVQQPSKPMHQWDKIYRSKIKKGYQDITEMVSHSCSSKDSVKYIDIDNKEVEDVIKRLMAFSNKSVEENYKVKASNVTQKQIDSAQEILDSIARTISKGTQTKEINDKLLQLYTVIPRKMKKVQDYLLNGKTISTSDDLKYARQMIAKEQDILDSMASSVSMLEVEEESSEVENKTILDTLGIEIEPVSKEEIADIKRRLGDISDKFRKAFKVKNHKTEKKFQTFLKEAKHKKVELFWHGSRNENFISILQKGLLIRPSGAIHTGSMFGDGIYYAQKARKAYGYTSGRGSYWARGSSNTAFMLIFQVHVGNQKHIYKHDSSCYRLSENVLKKSGHDSVHAHGGADLINDEFIVYNASQCTVKYLVELEG